MKTMKEMLQKMHAMRIGLLRYKEDETHLSLPVESIKGNQDIYEWTLIGDEGENLLNKQISLVQKQADDYIYVTGLVLSQRRKLKTVVTIQLLKVCWMVRKMKGNISWLEENFVHENIPETLKVAS